MFSYSLSLGFCMKSEKRTSITLLACSVNCPVQFRIAKLPRLSKNISVRRLVPTQGLEQSQVIFPNTTQSHNQRHKGN